MDRRGTFIEGISNQTYVPRTPTELQRAAANTEGQGNQTAVIEPHNTSVQVSAYLPTFKTLRNIFMTSD